MKGSYILLFLLPNSKEISIGKLGRLLFKKGVYLYVGSAMNGLEQRIQRHLRTEKKIHWHIDYLLPHTAMTAIYYSEDSKSREGSVWVLDTNGEAEPLKVGDGTLAVWSWK